MDITYCNLEIHTFRAMIIEFLTKMCYNISVKMHYTNEAEIKDTLTWATPLKIAEITFNHNPRSEIKVIEIYKKMIEVFNANKEDVKRLSD